MTDPSIRAMGPEAAALLAALHAACFEEPWDGAAFDTLLRQPGVIALARDDSFILLRRVADEAEVLTLCTHPEARRRGRAAELVAAALERLAAEGVSRLFLEVAADNRPAQALYTRVGFIEAGRRPNYYRRRGAAVDALLLARAVGPARGPIGGVPQDRLYSSPKR